MSDSDLTPGQSEEVRRLLAGARHGEPIPDEVALRLEETLASLSRERAETATAPASPPPIDLGARRRRRITTGLLAAAAVTVVGFTVPPLLSSNSNGSSAESSAADSAGSEPTGSEGAGTSESDAAAPDPSPTDPREDSLPLADADAGTVRPRSFDRDVARIVESEPRALQRTEPMTPLPDWCPVRSAWGEGTLLPVQYVVGTDAATRAVLVVRPAADGEATTDLFVCGEDEVLRSTTVPVE